MTHKFFYQQENQNDENQNDDQQNDDQQNAVNQIYEYAAYLMVSEKKDAFETQKALIEQGLDEESASIVVSNLEQQIKEAKKEGANEDIMYGALWCVGGLIVTAVTYSAASGGGTYVVAWGAILFGAIQFIKGLVNNYS